jgi:hypothetical protein
VCYADHRMLLCRAYDDFRAVYTALTRAAVHLQAWARGCVCRARLRRERRLAPVRRSSVMVLRDTLVHAGIFRRAQARPPPPARCRMVWE